MCVCMYTFIRDRIIIESIVIATIATSISCLVPVIVLFVFVFVSAALVRMSMVMAVSVVMVMV